jgi:hypothetical protein
MRQCKQVLPEMSFQADVSIEEPGTESSKSFHILPFLPLLADDVDRA